MLFSLDEDNAGMWNYYTKNRNQDGYSLTFDLKELMFKITGVQSKPIYYDANAFPIIYTEEEQNDIILKILNEYYSLWDKFAEYRNEIVDDCFDLLISIRFCFKHHSYDYEKEFRVVLKVENHEYYEAIKKKVIKFEESNGFFIPCVYLNCINENSLCEITASPMLKDEIDIQSLNSLLYQNGLEHVHTRASNCPKRY